MNDYVRVHLLQPSGIAGNDDAKLPAKPNHIANIAASFGRVIVDSADYFQPALGCRQARDCAADRSKAIVNHTNGTRFHHRTSLVIRQGDGVTG
jgi:hypothetical protein